MGQWYKDIYTDEMIFFLFYVVVVRGFAGSALPYAVYCDKTVKGCVRHGQQRLSKAVSIFHTFIQLSLCYSSL